MATIKEVAKRAGVSPSTVSRVLTGNVPVSDAARDRVLSAVRELNYQPNVLAQGLKGGRIKTIGLLVPNVRNLVFPAAIRGIEDMANKHGYTVVLCNTDENPAKERFYIDNLRRRLIDGFIFSTARPGNDLILRLQEEGFPVVCLIRQHPDVTADAVVLDNYGGAYAAVRYMLGRGLRQIALINGSLDILLYRQRFEGYQSALAEAGQSLPPEYIVHDISGWEDAWQAMTTMLQSGVRPDAVFATSDPKAVGVIRAVKDAGLRVPEDISVMGFDNFDLAAHLDPPLTTVAQPFYDMGAKACERLIKIIEAKRRPQPRVKVLPAQLVIRKSVI